ncbi:MAG: PIN domain-containing protein [Deltaproteobacteria bacterium]|nr:PIN domain-containing protein [Deltaproteobacteria bacterium]
MEPLDAAALPDGALLLVDSAPIIYVLDGHPQLARRFAPLFDRHARGELRLAVTTITIAEVLSGPLGAGDEVLARRYRVVLESWQVIDLSIDIAESAARLRKALKVKLPDAIQAASALAINADALVTHDRDFARLTSLRVLS